MDKGKKIIENQTFKIIYFKIYKLNLGVKGCPSTHTW